MNPIESFFIHHRAFVEALPGRIWEASWQATLLAAIVLAAQWILKQHLAARWRNALWLPVFARLLMPALPPARFSAYNWLPWTPPAITVPAQLPIHEMAPGHIKTVGIHETPSEISQNASSSASLLDRIRSVVESSHPLTLLALLWATGTLTTAAWGIVNYSRLRRRLRRAEVEVQPALMEQFAAAKQLLGEKRAELAVSSAANTPFVTGLWKAKVVLPEGLDGKLTDGDMRMVLLHELAHVKRGDLWMAWLGWLVTVLHWFNPAVRFITARARRDREMACDEWVLRFVEDSKGYGAALIRFLELSLPQMAQPGFGAIGIFESKLSLMQRIRRIADYRRSTLFGSGVGFAALAIIGALTLTAATAEAPAIQLVLNLSDGSRIVGTPAFDHFKVTTQYADLDIQLSQLRAVEFKGADRVAQLSLQNGDIVSGRFAATEIAMKTGFGQVVVPLAQVSRIEARRSGVGNALPEGCVLHYTFDDDEGGKVTDASGSGNDGTVRGATHVNDGKSGGAMSFNGNRQGVVAKSPAKLEVQDFTIMLWVKRGNKQKVAEGGSDGALFSFGQNGYGVGILHDDSHVYLSNVGIDHVSSQFKIDDDVFHHVAVTKKGSKVVFYLDGVADPATEYDTNFEFNTDAGVGIRPDAMVASFIGLIDDVAVFDRPLSDDEVKAVYDSQK